MGPFMSWVVAIDESGDLGKGTRYFCMAALIVRRPRHLRKAYDSIPTRGYESKFSNSSDEEISLILRSVAEVDVRIVYSAVDKYDYNGRFYGLLGNALYKAVLSDLLDAVGTVVPNCDLDILLDRCRFLKPSEFKDIARSKMTPHGCKIKRCDKRNSEDTPCIQIADYIAGAVWQQLNYNNESFIAIIQEKVVVARTDNGPPKATAVRGLS